jgi:2-iminobutanoate/2-iminopropanoate deaminase
MNTKPPFSPSRIEGNLVFLSGQIGIKDGALVSDDFKEQFARAIENILRILGEHSLSLENVIDVTAFLIDQGDYQVFNEAYGESFKEPFPTRTTVTVKSLPFGAKVELKVIAHK